MRKPLPNKITSEEELKELLEETLPYSEIEAFLGDHGISRFSMELSWKEGGHLVITDLHIIE